MFLANKNSLGIDISDYNIELICLGREKDKLKVLALTREELVPGIVQDCKIVKKEELKNVLINALKKPGFEKIETNNAVFAIPESKSFIHVFVLPDHLEKNREKEIIEARAREVFPFNLDEIYFDYRIRERNQKKEVLLIAASKNIVDDYLNIFSEIGLKVKFIIVESESLAQSLVRNKKENILVADIGSNFTNFSIFKGGDLRISATVKVAGDRLSEMLSKELRVSIKKAEELKKEIGLNPEKEEGKIFLVLQKEIREIIEEMQKFIDYFMKKEGESIKEVVLAGGTALLPRIAEYFSENLDINVILGDPWQGIEIDPEKNFKDILEINPLLYATCIGSALKGLEKDKGKQIDLLKKIDSIKLNKSVTGFINNFKGRIKK